MNNYCIFKLLSCYLLVSSFQFIKLLHYHFPLPKKALLFSNDFGIHKFAIEASNIGYRNQFWAFHLASISVGTVSKTKFIHSLHHIFNTFHRFHFALWAAMQTAKLLPQQTTWQKHSCKLPHKHHNQCKRQHPSKGLHFSC